MQRARYDQFPAGREAAWAHVDAGEDGVLPEKKDADNLTMFHLVFALSRDAQSSVIKMCKQIAEEVRCSINGVDIYTHLVKLALGLLYEEKRCGFVQKEITTMIKTREKWLAQQLADDGNPKPGMSTSRDSLLQYVNF